MAERIRNQLARAHVPIRPSRILTLAEFLEPFAPFQEAPESLVQLLGKEDLDDQLAERGFALGEKRLLTALPITTGPIVIDGFLTFTPAELAFIERLAAQTSVTVCGARTPVDAVTSVFSALTLDQEVEQIAARILEYSARGREFHEMGILLRVRDPYAPALESTLARFGIPAKFHFAKALSAHPAIQYITGIVRSLLSGWDHADLLPLLRMPINGLGATHEGDRLDFDMRESLPAAGLDPLEQYFPDLKQLRELTALDPWKRVRLTPTDWSTRLKTLRALIPSPEITGRAQLQAWRSTSAALDAFDRTLDVAAIALDDTKIPLAVFWPNVETAIRMEKFHVPDRRRNVVNVIDIYEARQWELRIAFVPGLTERHFPKDRLLFELATASATEETILSYPRFNDKGDAILRSFFIEEEGEPSGTIRILPKPVGQGHALPNRAAPDLRTQHATLSPTSIESFVQCPFQFFAGKTLQLRPRPLKPRDRLDILLQGSILHQAIAEGSFDPVFERACRKNNIPGGYRTEAVRLELLRHFEAFQADRQWPLNWPGRIEEKFLLVITPELSINGRIDRLLIGPDNQAIVIDYKYSPAAKVRERVSVQGGLYLLAAERVFHLEPAGMFYCALREPISWDGWHANIPSLNLGESRTPVALRELIGEAEQQAIETFNSIVSGNKEVNPADPTKCRYCDYKNICRIESKSNTGYWLPATGYFVP
jgi:ATP-dependent helicase/DNAse subunit B